MSENRVGPRTPEPAQHNLRDHQSLDFLVIVGNTNKDAPKTFKRPIPVTLVTDEQHSPFIDETTLENELDYPFWASQSCNDGLQANSA
jgi:hypothetical protein